LDKFVFLISVSGNSFIRLNSITAKLFYENGITSIL
jgi:hypothetical protein